MTGDGDPAADDEELMSMLRRIAERADPVPESVVVDGRAALATRGLDAELAELLLDSAHETAQVRGADDDVRLLSFYVHDVSVELRVEYGNGEVSLRGMVDGATGPVDLELGDGRRSLPVDEDGGFATRLPRGAARFWLRTRGGRVVRTRWVLL
jgi:hypothetical protein